MREPTEKEEWEDVTRQCLLTWITAFADKGGHYIKIVHNNSNVGCLGLGNLYKEEERGYKIEIASRDYYTTCLVLPKEEGNMHTFRILKRVNK